MPETLNEKALADQAWRDLEISADATGALEVGRVTLPIEKVRALVAERRASTLPAGDYAGLVEKLRAPIEVNPLDIVDAHQFTIKVAARNAEAATAIATQDARIAALVADAERSEKHRNDLYDKVVSQRTEIAALRACVKAMAEALEPFASVASEWDDEPAELSISLEWNEEGGPVPNLLVEDFRAARRARAVKEGE